MYLYSSSVIYEQRSVSNERADVGWDVNSETEVHFILALFFFCKSCVLVFRLHVFLCSVCTQYLRRPEDIVGSMGTRITRRL